MTDPTRPHRLSSLDDAVETLLATVEGALHVAAPLGIGKPHRLLNALSPVGMAMVAFSVTWALRVTAADDALRGR